MISIHIIWLGRIGVVDMKKYLEEYVKEIDNLLEKETINKNTVEKHLVKIKFFQHERLIHLLVTLFYALAFLICLVLSIYIWTFLIVSIILICFLIPYILHYFFLENNAQYLYKQYDKMLGKTSDLS